MKEILGRNIKEVLKQYPAIEGILADYSIGCTGCSLGTCLLKDIVEIHNLTLDQEQALMARVAEVVYPGQAVEIPRIGRKAVRKSNDAKMSPPLQSLVNEHKVIKRFIALVPVLLDTVDMTSEECRATLRAGTGFIRTYADAYHHAKEEKILFGFFDSNSDIIRSFLDEHETGRSHVGSAHEGIEARDSGAVREHLAAYAALLTEHIKKEDEILYPWMNRTLSDSQVGNLFAAFAAVDNEYRDEDMKQRAFVAELEKQTAASPVLKET
jgi:hemerythrin-like domain-containing protein